MVRNRKSAKKAGASMETAVVNYLNWALDTDTIERRHLQGVKDTGDVSGVRFMGKRVVIEVKNKLPMNISEGLRQAEIERGNDDAAIGVSVQKRPGVGITSLAGQSQQLVCMTLETLAVILNDGLPVGPDDGVDGLDEEANSE